MAAIQECFAIRASDFRYTTASLCFEPVRIAEMLGVPGLTKGEARAMFVFWRDSARRWGISVPEEQAEFRTWMEEYEEREYGPTAEARDVAVALGDDFCRRFFPGPLKHVGYGVLRSMCDDRLLTAVGQPPASPAMKRLTSAAVNFYLRSRRVLPASSEERLLGPWCTAYAEPNPTEVGPEWATDITAASRLHRCAGR